MAAYYNEHDPFAAAWLRELIKAGLIADGEVDERSIADVTADDVRGFVQCHWFAGIGGWSYALRLAGWPDERAVWTGSCPCQPFSSAGTQAGGTDPRDLWPTWFQLIAECRPRVVFGEQVEAAIGHGWLDRLCDDLEAEDYAVGACGLPGPVSGAYDIRSRLWFVAESTRGGSQRRGMRSGVAGGPSDQLTRSGDVVLVADAGGRELRHDGRGQDAGAPSEVRGETRQQRIRPDGWTDGAAGRIVAVPDSGASAGVGRILGADPRSQGDEGAESAHGRADGDMADAAQRGQRIDGRASRDAGHLDERESVGKLGESEGQRLEVGERIQRDPSRLAGSQQTGYWDACDWLPCRDGKARPVEPGTFPLAHGVSARVGRLRGYGNAIKPPLAQAFIEAYMSLQRTEGT